MKSRIRLSVAVSLTSLVTVFASATLNSSPAAASGTVSVTTYGATGTGITDDTQAFTQALNQLNMVGGGTLVVPAGSYLVQPDVLNVRDNTTVSAGGTTLLASKTGYSLLGISGTNIEVDGLTIDGTSQILHVVEIGKGSTNVTFRGVTVQNAGQPSDPTNPNYSAPVVGIRVEGDGRGMLFDGVTVRNVTATHSDGTSMVARGLLLDNGGSATTVSKSVTVRNSSFSQVGPKDDGDCLVIQGSADVDANLTIANNNFNYCHKRAIKLQVGGVTVQNNTVNNPFLGNNVYQVRAEINGAPSLDMFSAVGLFSSNMTVSGNTFGGVGSFYQGVEIAQASGVGPLQNITVQGNTISNGPTSQTGAPSSLIRSASPITTVAITSNKLTNAPYGIFMEQPLAGTVTITCNTYASVGTQSANSYGVEQPCTGVLDQYQIATSGGSAQGANGSQISAQTFRAGMSGALTRVSAYVWIQQQCTAVNQPLGCQALGPGDLIAQIRTVDATGMPTETILSSATVPQASVGLYSPSWIDLIFGSPAQMTAGMTYALALTSPSTSGMYYWGLVTTGDPSVVSQAYPNGQASAKTTCCGWSLEPYMDFAFKTYVASSTVLSANPLPTLSTMSPMSAQKGGAGFTLAVTGSSFVTGSTVRWNGTNLATTPDPNSPTTRLTAVVPAANIVSSGTSEITVFNPTPGGDTSNLVDVFVTDTGATVDASTSVSGFTIAQLRTTNASGTTTTVNATPSAGNGALTVAHYAADPVAVLAPLSSANYYDVHVESGSSYTSVNLVICNGGNLVYWWNAQTRTWTQAAPQQLDPQSGCVDVSLTPQSSPNISQLAGTPFAILLDKMPPTTRAAVTGATGTNGWYVGPVTVTLSATDTLTSVRSTTYGLDGGTTWQTYTAPLAFPRDGSYAVQFRSADVLGNVETPEISTFKIDQTPPTVTFTGNAGTYTVDESVSITCTAVDPPDAFGTVGSGLASSSCQNISGPAYSFALGTNSLWASATDKAGNVGYGATSFNVQVTYSSLCNLTTRFIQSSAKYQALSAADQAAMTPVAMGLCQRLSNASVAATPTQQAALIAAYQTGVTVLVSPGYLTQTRATTLVTLSKAL